MVIEFQGRGQEEATTEKKVTHLTFPDPNIFSRAGLEISIYQRAKSLFIRIIHAAINLLRACCAWESNGTWKTITFRKSVGMQRSKLRCSQNSKIMIKREFMD